MLRNLSNNKKVSKLPRLSKFADDLSQQSCKKHISDSHIFLIHLTYHMKHTGLSTPQMVVYILLPVKII